MKHTWSAISGEVPPAPRLSRESLAVTCACMSPFCCLGTLAMHPTYARPGPDAIPKRLVLMRKTFPADPYYGGRLACRAG